MVPKVFGGAPGAVSVLGTGAGLPLPSSTMTSSPAPAVWRGRCGRRLAGGRLACLGRRRFGDVAVGLRAGVGLLLLEFLEAELVVFLHLAHLLLHLQDLEVEFLDRAGQRADLLFQRGDARIAGLLREFDRGFVLAAEELGQAEFRQQPGIGGSLVRRERVEEADAFAGRGGRAGQQQDGERTAQDRSKMHGRLTVEGSSVCAGRAFRLLSGCETSAKFCFAAPVNEKGGRSGRLLEQVLLIRLRNVSQLPALSAVTARRFCDQQEMSSQTATGLSLP